MYRLSNISVVGILLGAGACVTTGPSVERGVESPAPRPALKNDELRSFLSNAALLPPILAGITQSHPAGEMFLDTRVYLRLSGGHRIEGIFSIQDDIFCVEGRSIALQCRKVFQTHDETYELIDQRTGETKIVTRKRLS